MKKRPSISGDPEIEAILDDFAQEDLERKDRKRWGRKRWSLYNIDPDDADIDLMQAFHYDLGDK